MGFYGYFGLPIPYIDHRLIVVENLPFTLHYDGSADHISQTRDLKPKDDITPSSLCEIYKNLIRKYRPETHFHKD